MQVEHQGSDLILRIAEGELERDRTLLDRASALALEIAAVQNLIAVVPIKEFNSRHDLFGTRWHGGLREKMIILQLNIRTPIEPDQPIERKRRTPTSTSPTPTPKPKPRKRRGKKK